MSRTYRKFPYEQPHRNPKGRKKAIINEARKKAIPPDPWDDLEIDNLCFLPYKVAKRLWKEGKEKEEIEKTLVNHYKLSHKEAQGILRRLR